MRKKIIKFEILLIVIGLAIIGYHYNIDEYVMNNWINPMLNKVEEVVEEQTKEIAVEGTATIETPTIYGTYFNINGYIENIDLENIKLVIYSEKKEYEYELITTYSDTKINFSTNKKINEGINLDKLDIGEYTAYIESGEEYYSLINNGNYLEDLEYYTLTKAGSNNRIIISYDNGLSINIEEKDLPNDVYDIAIDPGHGGNDPGAVHNGIYEKTYTLSLSKLIKSELEEIGYKVYLTRNIDKWLYAYGDSGRVTKTYESKAKIMFSVHINAIGEDIEYGKGIEIYVCPNSNIEFAEIMANNIVEVAKTNYSTKDKYKVANGIYMRSFLESEIEEYSEEALEDGFKPYNYKEYTPFYYMLRETGGIVTNAYIDGRDISKDKNNYYDSNIGIESYIIEFGYISDPEDMYNIKNNSIKYAEAIKLSIQEYIK